MKRYSFEYNEPRIGTVETNVSDPKEEDILKLIEEEFPEALDVEIISTEDF